MCQDSKQDKENHEIYTDLSFTIEHAIQGLADMIILIILFKPPVLDTFLRVFLDNIESPNLKQFSHHLGPHYGEPCGQYCNVYYFQSPSQFEMPGATLVRWLMGKH